MSTSVLYTYLWEPALFMNTNILYTYLWAPACYIPIYEYHQFRHLIMGTSIYTFIHEHQHFTPLLLSISILNTNYWVPAFCTPTYLWAPAFYTPPYEHQHFIHPLKGSSILYVYLWAPPFTRLFMSTSIYLCKRNSILSIYLCVTAS